MTDPGFHLPFLRPNPPSLSSDIAALRDIESSGIFSNFGPSYVAFQEEALSVFFGSSGNVVPVCNATLGLMLAMKTRGRVPDGSRNRLALMPSFCFAATAQAALWAGYQPHFYDVEPDTWLPAEACEREFIEQREAEIGLIVPYATFGAAMDLARYDRYAEDLGIPCVIDAAASLGTKNGDGTGFGSATKSPVVYSMHATKTFATSEGGLVYTTDATLADDLKDMANFGFGAARTATMPGLNAKLSEVAALIARKRLIGFEAIVAHREAAVARYRLRLPEFHFQRPTGSRQAHQFSGLLMPKDCAIQRDELMDVLRQSGIGSAKYFSPHLRHHPFFNSCSHGPLAVTEDLSDRIICLPLYDDIKIEEVDAICAVISAAVAP